MLRMHLMAIAGDEYYVSNYRDYEKQNPDKKLEFYLELLRSCVPGGGRVFELGVGMGRFLELAAREFQCAGADPNAHGVSETRKRVPEDVAVSLGSVSQIPAEPGPDAVVAWDVLEHLADLAQGLETIHAKLARDGALVAVVPVYDGPLGWLVRILDKDPTHVSKISRHAWLEQLERTGFEVVRSGGILRGLFFARWYAHLTHPRWLLRSVGTAFYFVARKA